MEFMVQIMPEVEAETTPYNPFDLTEVWPHKDSPRFIIDRQL